MDNNDSASLTDGIEVEVKGPGKQWRWRDEYLRKQELERAENSDDETVGEVKGPGPEWETNSEGVYINRDDDE